MQTFHLRAARYSLYVLFPCLALHFLNEHVIGGDIPCLISNYLSCIQLDSCLVNYNNGSRQLTYFVRAGLAPTQIKNISLSYKSWLVTFNVSTWRPRHHLCHFLTWLVSPHTRNIPALWRQSSKLQILTTCLEYLVLVRPDSDISSEKFDNKENILFV